MIDWFLAGLRSNPELALFLAIGTAYGVWAEMCDADNHFFFNLVIVVSLMHFWYDGFIWSVRKRQVQLS